MTKQHKPHALQVRRQRFEQVIESAAHASRRHDSYSLFQIINQFAPKQPKRRIQLRTVTGQLATPVEELAILKRYVADNWQGSPLHDPVPHVIPGAPFTMDDVLRGLNSIPVLKAVAAPFAPGVIWRAHCHLLAPWLYEQLCQWWDSTAPAIPACWKNGWMHLIPKPLRAPVTPSALRPLALQEPLGKCIMGILGQLGQQDTWTHMMPLPLWAYLPHRSTQDALLRVSLHCRNGRELMSSHRSTPANRARQPGARMVGAVQLFLDLSRAFDCVDRVRLFSRLAELSVRPSLIKLLTCWHQSAAYHVSNGIDQAEVPISLGVRQGCKSAPWLWNCVLTLLMHDLTQHVPYDWLLAHVNWFADDCQAGDLFYSNQDLSIVLGYFGHIIGMLQSYGLQINLQKSTVLLTATGTCCRTDRLRHVEKKDGRESICIPFQDRMFCIPIEKQAKYLGTVVSYGSFEDLTTRQTEACSTCFFTDGQMAHWQTGLAF